MWRYSALSQPVAVQLFSKLSSVFLHCGSVLSRCFYLKKIAWLRTKGDRNKACLQNWAKYRAARHHQREVSAHLTQIRHLTQNCREKHGHRLHKQTALDEPDTNPGHNRWSQLEPFTVTWQNLLLLQSPPRKTRNMQKSSKVIKHPFAFCFNADLNDWFNFFILFPRCASL